MKDINDTKSLKNKLFENNFFNLFFENYIK